jgi:YD repeat-containing protein
MRPLLLLILIFSAIASCGQDKRNERKVTVILFDNQNPGLSLSVDTLMKAKRFDLATTNIDLFFCNNFFNLPYYVPTDGVFKTATKDKECDMKIYPANVKCYEYDNKNRVIKMTVNGSGTMNNFGYKYNNNNQITEITDHGHDKYILTYNSDGTISELRKSDSLIEKRLIFIYD